MKIHSSKSGLLGCGSCSARKAGPAVRQPLVQRRSEPPPVARPLKLTKRHLDAMRKVKNGADVWSYEIAGLLREVQKIDPTLIDITKPMMFRGTGAEQMPYFGAILTGMGKEALRYTGKQRC